MSDVVIDTTVVAFANCDLAARRRGNAFDRRLTLLEDAVGDAFRIRYNTKLLREYEGHVVERRNDVIELFFELLASSRAILVERSSLSRQHNQLRIGIRWPSHDQHLLAAAVGGDRPDIYVTERCLAGCADGVLREFRVRVRLV